MPQRYKRFSEINMGTKMRNRRTFADDVELIKRSERMITICGHYIVNNDKTTAIQVIKNKYGHSLDDSRRMLKIVESWYAPIQWVSMIKYIREFNPEYLL